MEAPVRTIRRARELRRAMSLPEVLLWRALRRAAADGLRFRRQHPVGPYVLDFYCHEARLAVEVDGYSHIMGDRPAADARRDVWLRREGIETLRLPATDVLKDLDATITAIAATAHRRKGPAPSASE